MLDKTKHMWYNFKYEHEDVVSFGLFVGLALTVIMLIMIIGSVIAWLAIEPTCHQFAQAFTGEYINDPFRGCHIKLADGHFYYYKNILITP